MIVELEIRGLVRIAAPEAGVGLVPHFEIPLRYFLGAVAFHVVARPLVDELTPLLVALRRIGPAREELREVDYRVLILSRNRLAQPVYYQRAILVQLELPD